jgi:superfamily II DNA/RNA helicase
MSVMDAARCCTHLRRSRGHASDARNAPAATQARAFRVRVLVSTDLNARGLDLPYVNLVVNVDVPANDATYMHRVGRTGRFGTSGVAVSLVAPRELAQLQGIVARAKGGTLLPMPDEVPSSWYAAELPAEQSAALHELHEQGAALRTRHDAARALPKHAVPERAAASSADAVEPSPAAAHAADACQQHLPWPSWQQQQAAYSFWWWAWRRRCEAELRPAPAWATPPTPLL